MRTHTSIQSVQHPKWWLLSLLLPLMGGMLLLEHRVHVSAFWHQFIGVGIILVVYGLMGLWLWLNSDYFAEESASDLIIEEDDSVIVYTVDKEGNRIEPATERELQACSSELSAIENSVFDISDTIHEIEVELQAEYTRLHPRPS